MKVLYFCRVVDFSSVGFGKLFLTRMRCFATGVGELNDSKIFCSQCGIQKRCEESTLPNFAIEREGATYYFRREFRYETIISFFNEVQGISMILKTLKRRLRN